MTTKGICHIEITCHNARSLAEFYEKLFGWKLNSMMGDEYIMFQPAEGTGGAFSNQPDADIASTICVYSEVDDIEAYLAKAVELGGQEVKGKSAIPGHGYYGQFKDPEGHLMGLFSGN